MATSIEISSTTIRLCQTTQGRVTAIESIPLSGDTDPVAALEAAPLPSPLGNVRLALNHSDLLVRTMVQPPVPHERLDRLVRFEAANLAQDDQKLMVSWRLLPVGGTGHMRIVTLLAKQDLVERLRAALATHNGKLVGLTHSGVGLYHAWRHQLPTDTSTAAILDVGGGHLHVTLVRDGELMFCRSQAPAGAKLVEDVAELRGIGQDDAASLVSKLSTNPPDDIVSLVERNAAAVATNVGNTINFAKAQLQLDSLELHGVYLSGAGARVPGFADALSHRLKVPARLLNPFAGRIYGADQGQLDRQARLPSSWTSVFGLSDEEPLALDVMDQARAERRVFWMTAGALRTGAAACVALLVLAMAFLQLQIASQDSALEELVGDDDSGLVPRGQALVDEAAALDAERAALAARTSSLARSRDPGRVAVEFLNLLSGLQDPDTHPVYIQRFGVQPRDGGVLVELEGFAQDAVDRNKAEVLNGFRARMREAYSGRRARITRVSDLKVAAEPQRQPFHWVIEIATGPVVADGAD